MLLFARAAEFTLTSRLELRLELRLQLIRVEMLTLAKVEVFLEDIIGRKRVLVGKLSCFSDIAILYYLPNSD